MNLTEMLNLPRAERSRYIAAIPLTREFVFDALEPHHVKHVRRAIVTRGGTWREEYHPMGLAVTATFRTHRALLDCCAYMARWLNEQARAAHEDLGLPLDVDLLYKPETVARPACVPAMRCEVVWAVGRGREETWPAHPRLGHWHLRHLRQRQPGWVVSARSIDGRVWWDGNGWTPESETAQRMDEGQALAVIERARARNAEAEADAIVGRLSMEHRA